MSAKLDEQPQAAEAEPEGDEDAEPVESIEPDDDDAAEQEDEGGGAAESEPQEALAPSVEAMMRSLESEHTRHEKALRKIMGEGFDGYTDCPVCMSMGYVFGSPLNDDEGTEVCTACKGFGEVRTASLVPQHATRQCMACLGNGYVTKQAPAPLPSAPVGAPLAVAPDTAAVSPEVEHLRGLGYTVVPPYVPPTTSF